MILLALAAVGNPILPIFRGVEAWGVSERTVYARSQSERGGTVRIKLTSTSRDGWNALVARTEWDKGKWQSVDLRQNTATGELRCVSVKGIDASYSFDPPLTIWTGANGEGEGIRATRSLRPFGHFISEHHFVAATFDQEYITETSGGGRGGGGSVIASYLRLTGEVSWDAGDGYFPRKMILRADYHSTYHDSLGPGFDPVSVRLCGIPGGTERLYERTAQGEKLIYEMTS